MTSSHHDTTPFAPLTLAAQFDRMLVWDQGTSVRYLVAELGAPEVVSSTPRVPLHLALVIDASGSMAGAPLASACQAASRVVEGLVDGDRLSVVSFAEDVQLHAPSVAINAAEKARVRSLLRTVATRGSTDLAAGWLAGAECVARELAERSGFQNRVVVLSDGHANRGLQEPSQLAEIAAGLRQRGVYSSAVGIGDGYSSEQLLAISEAGGGRLHHTDRPEEIAEVLLGELDESQQTVVENVELQVTIPPGTTVELFDTYPWEIHGATGRCVIGSLPSGGTREVVLKFQLPPGAAGAQVAVQLHANFQSVGQPQRLTTPPVELHLTYVTGSVNMPQPRNLPISQIVARHWQAHLVRSVVRLNREGAFAAARQLFEEQFGYFRRYCEPLPGGPELLRQFERVARHIDRPWSERTRKNVDLALYKRSRGERDWRSAPQQPWFENLPE